jgi:hypothetical protein
MQSGKLSFEPAEPDDNFVQFLAVDRLLGSNCPQHFENKIGSFVADALTAIPNEA